MAIVIKSVFENKDYPTYNKVIENIGNDFYLHLTIESPDIVLSKIRYVYSQTPAYNTIDQTRTLPTGTNGVYKYDIWLELTRESGSDFVYVELLDASSNIVHTEKLPVTYYNYYKPELYAQMVDLEVVNETTGTANATLEYDFIWWNSHFTSTARNSVKVTYKYQIGSYTSTAQTLHSGIVNQHIKGTVKIPGLTMGGTARGIFTIQDSVSDIQTIYVDIYNEDIFNWSQSDFQFNVPVVHNDHISLAKDIGIYGGTIPQNGYTAAQELIAYKSPDLYIGYGGYDYANSDTYIAGNNVIMLGQKDIKVEDASLMGLMRAMSNTYQLTATGSTKDVANGTDNSLVLNTPSCTAKLFGNNLYVRFRNTPASSANPFKTGWFIGSVIIQHGGKITGCEYMSNMIAGSTAVASLQMQNIEITDTTMKFDVFLYCPEGTSIYSALTTFNVPVQLNLDAYTG